MLHLKALKLNQLIKEDKVCQQEPLESIDQNLLAKQILRREFSKNSYERIY